MSMTRRLVTAYWSGRTAYPDEPNPYSGDELTARMWRSGWHRTRDGLAATPELSNTELDLPPFIW
jgi:hypothetical protein